MEPKGSIPHSQMPATCPSPEQRDFCVNISQHDTSSRWSCWHLAQPPSRRTDPSRLSATAYSVCSRLPSILEAVPPIRNLWTHLSRKIHYFAIWACHRSCSEPNEDILHPLSPILTYKFHYCHVTYDYVSQRVPSRQLFQLVLHHLLLPHIQYVTTRPQT